MKLQEANLGGWRGIGRQAKNDKLVVILPLVPPVNSIPPADIKVKVKIAYEMLYIIALNTTLKAIISPC